MLTFSFPNSRPEQNTLIFCLDFCCWYAIPLWSQPLEPFLECICVCVYVHVQPGKVCEAAGKALIAAKSHTFLHMYPCLCRLSCSGVCFKWPGKTRVKQRSCTLKNKQIIFFLLQKGHSRDFSLKGTLGRLEGLGGGARADAKWCLRPFLTSPEGENRSRTLRSHGGSCSCLCLTCL